MGFWIVWSLIADTVTFIYLVLYLNRLRLHGSRFNFRITDMWSAAIILSPTMALIGYLFQQIKPGALNSEALMPVLLSLLIFLNQFGGLAIGRMDIELPPYEKEVTWWESAISILVGAAYGALMALIPPFLFYYVSRLSSRLQEINRLSAGKNLQERLSRKRIRETQQKDSKAK